MLSDALRPSFYPDKIIDLKDTMSSLFRCSPDVNYEELARCTDDFNGAQCKAVCVEAVSTLGGFSSPRLGLSLKCLH